MPKPLTLAYIALVAMLALLIVIAKVASETRDMVRAKTLEFVPPHSAVTHVPDPRTGNVVDLTTVQGVGPGVPRDESDVAYFKRVVTDAAELARQLEKGR